MLPLYDHHLFVIFASFCADPFVRQQHLRGDPVPNVRLAGSRSARRSDPTNAGIAGQELRYHRGACSRRPEGVPRHNNSGGKGLNEAEAGLGIVEMGRHGRVRQSLSEGGGPPSLK